MVPTKGAWTVITTIDKMLHRYKRKVVSKFLGSEALKSHEPHFKCYLDSFCDKLTAEGDHVDWSSPKLMSDLCRSF